MRSAIPTGWTERTISQLLTANSLFCDGDWVESEDQDSEGHNRLVQLADVGDGRFLDKSNRFMNDRQFSKLKCTALVEGDILIARMPDPIGRACLFPHRGERCATVVDVAILRNVDADPHWLMATINSLPFRRKIEAASGGTTRTRISRGFFAGLTLLVPPPVVQKKIAVILTSIDTAIEKTEALIEKYQQIKAGLMQDLFTRGILPNGQLRPPRDQAPELYQETSMGWIPREWSPVSLRNLVGAANIINGPFGSDLLTSELRTEGIPVLYVQDVKAGVFSRVSNAHVTQAKANELAFCNVKRGDVLVAKVGAPPCDSCVYPFDEKAVVTQDVIRVRLGADVNAEYISSLLNSPYGRKAVKRISIEGTRERVSLTEFKGLFFPVAESHEQAMIGARLEKAQASIAAERVKREKLRLQKLGLMQDLLTGQVPVKVGAGETANG